MKKRSTLALIQNIMCYNQAQLALYLFNSQEEHEKLSTFLDINNRSQNEETVVFSPEFKDELDRDLKTKYKNLESNLTNKLGKIHQQNFSYILNYFSQRNKILPRISIKIFADKKIHTLFRDRYLYKEQIKNNTITEGKNTAFKEIAKGAKFYLNNNIPQSIKNKSYYNPRIIPEQARKYQEPNFISKITNLFDNSIDIEWIKCWRDIDLRDDNDENFKPCDPELCYKSTLVVPISLNMADIKDNRNFINFFNIDDTKARAIFGFLCLDHVSTNFFKEIDISIIYIVSDLLSLYLMQYTKNTSGSKTVKKVKSYLAKEQ